MQCSLCQKKARELISNLHPSHLKVIGSLTIAHKSVFKETIKKEIGVSIGTIVDFPRHRALTILKNVGIASNYLVARRNAPTLPI